MNREREKLPGSVSRLYEATKNYICSWIDLEGYIDHSSPQSSIDAARLRLEIAKGEFNIAMANHNTSKR